MAKEHLLARSVDEIIANLPRQEQIIVTRLRSLILECLPNAIEKNSYGVPYYTHHRMICFIWPPTIRWGNKDNWSKKSKGVVLGFCQGNRMSNEEGKLLAEGRKQVYCVYFTQLNEINEAEVRAWLFEDELIDESFRQLKKARKK